MGGRVAILLALLFCCSVGRAEDVKQIPLSQIWAYNMPSTRDVQELEPEAYGREARSLSEAEQFERINKSIIQQIRLSLQLEPDTDAQGRTIKREPGKAFAVVGTGKEALIEAKAILSGRKEPQNTFPAKSKLSIVFHSLEAGSYVHLTSVERMDNRIIIHFQFVPHFTAVVSSHFALIPVVDLPSGKIEVQIVQEPMKDEYGVGKGLEPNAEWQEQVICKPFSFTIEQEK
jgi:hypothetical protein